MPSNLDFPAITEPLSGDEIIHAVDDPSGTPSDVRVTVDQVLTRGSFSATIASTAGTTVNFQHNLGTQDVHVTMRRIAVPAGTTYPLGEVLMRWVPLDDNHVTIDFDTYIREANEFRVTVSK